MKQYDITVKYSHGTQWKVLTKPDPDMRIYDGTAEGKPVQPAELYQGTIQECNAFVDLYSRGIIIGNGGFKKQEPSYDYIMPR